MSSYSTQQNSQNPHQTQNFQNAKKYPNAFGIYNFNKSNNTNTIQKNSSSTLLEEIINNQVRSFIVLNQKYIIDSLVDEVEQKIQEKISPINNEINNIKADFNSLYNEEIKNFKEENVLNDCKENISNISNEYNMLQEKFIKYNNDINSYDITDKRFNLLNKLNNELENVINEINKEKDNQMEMDEENIINEMKKQGNNKELNDIFNEVQNLIKNGLQT